MRTPEEIQAVLENAKLDRKELIPFCQEIAFDEHFPGAELKLLELEPEVSECIKVGTRLVIRGDENDAAVLCTSSSTFEVKQAETSNSLLILDQVCCPDEIKDGLENFSPEKPETGENDLTNGEVPAHCPDSNGALICKTRKILNLAHCYWELRRIKPSLARIYYILEPNSYRGPEYESGVTSGEKSCSFEYLFDKVSASQGEIENHVQRELKTYITDGKLRLLQNEYLFQVLSQVLGIIDSNSWDKADISKRDVLKDIGTLHPEFVIQKIFDWFFVGRPDDAEENKFEMNEYEICRFIGETILKSSRRFLLADFKKAWQQSVPDGLTVKLGQLEGLAVCDEGFVWYLAEDLLPESILERFAVLFETKQKWTQEEILPFIRGLAASSHSLGLLLAKHTRVLTTNGRKFYCAKHTK